MLVTMTLLESGTWRCVCFKKDGKARRGGYGAYLVGINGVFEAMVFIVLMYCHQCLLVCKYIQYTIFIGERRVSNFWYLYEHCMYIL